jgi:hypothetical protein
MVFKTIYGYWRTCMTRPASFLEDRYVVPRCSEREAGRMRMDRRLALNICLVVAAVLVAHALSVHTDVAQWVGFGVLLVCAAVIISSREWHGIAWKFGSPDG